MELREQLDQIIQTADNLEDNDGYTYRRLLLLRKQTNEAINHVEEKYEYETGRNITLLKVPTWVDVLSSTLVLSMVALMFFFLIWLFTALISGLTAFPPLSWWLIIFGLILIISFLVCVCVRQRIKKEKAK